jgi:hypothetical protein
MQGENIFLYLFSLFVTRPLWAVFRQSQHLTLGEGNFDHQKQNREGPAGWLERA